MATWRKILKILSTPSSRLEPVSVELECGHRASSRPTAKRVKCIRCRKKRGILPDRGAFRINRKRKETRVIEACISVCDGPNGNYVDFGTGAHVLTFGMKASGVSKRNMLSGLRLYVEDGAAVPYVRARVLELMRELDGTIVRCEITDE